MSRTYSQDEVAAILKEAYRISDGSPDADRATGLTLDELASMAAEHGLDADTVRRAAARLEATSTTQPIRSFAGIRWKVGHHAVLPGRMTDAEWSDIVADCRRLFEARGQVDVDGNSRTWRNGNLFVTAEPSGDGETTVMHMGSRNDTIPGLIGGGLGPIVMTLIFSTMALAGVDPDLFVVAGILGPIGLALAGSGLFLGRSWVANRESQMHEIAGRALDRRTRVLSPERESKPRIDLDDILQDAPETQSASRSGRSRS